MASKQIPMDRDLRNMLGGVGDPAARAMWRDMFYKASTTWYNEHQKMLRSRGDARNESKAEVKPKES